MKTITLAIALSLFSTALNAERVEEIIEKTLGHYENMESFYAEFEQRQCDVVRGICCDYEGKIYFVKPNFFRMEIENPEQIYVGDSVSLWIYLPEKKHAIRQSLGQVPFQINPDHFLVDYQKRFSADLASETAKTYEILLTPKESTDIYDSITISIAKDDHQISAITIFDQAGSENSFVFSKTEINKKISKKKFEFKPPKGTQVDEY
jgi:chaperone LolA